MSAYYLGIDGGGTKTRAVILDDSGRLIGVGTGGSSNYGYVGVPQATSNIKAAVDAATAGAGIDDQDFDGAFLGLAGVVSQTDRDTVLTMAHTLKLAAPERIGTDHDCRIALAGGLGGEPGIVQIIGTGTSTFGINAHGERWMSGGWGRLLADEGGGYWLGIEAMKAATAAYDGRGAPTALHNPVLDALGIAEIGEIMRVLYVQSLPVSDIAALGRLVIEAAREGDSVASDIIARGMAEVARCVAAVARKLQFPPDVRLAYAGGVTQATDVVIPVLERAVHTHLPHCRITSPQFDAATGAALLAMQQHGKPITPEITDNLTISLSERRHA